LVWHTFWQLSFWCIHTT